MNTQELDPTYGHNLNVSGAKADSGKPRPGLVLGGFWPALEALEIPDSRTSTFDITSTTNLFPLLAQKSYAKLAGASLDLAQGSFQELRTWKWGARPLPFVLLIQFEEALSEVVKIGSLGAAKYTDDGWLHVPNGIARYSDALARHALKLIRGEKHDPEFGTHHAGHIAWNALACLTLALKEGQA